MDSQNHVDEMWLVQRRMEQEAQRGIDHRLQLFKNLCRIGRDDPTVAAFIDAYRHGRGGSLETVLLELCRHLAREKADLMKRAVTNFAASTPTIIITDSEQ